MKRYFLLIILILLSFLTDAQSWLQRSSGVNTLVDGRLAVDKNFILPRFNDSTAANLVIGTDSCGAQFYNRTDGFIYYRTCYPYKKWIKQGSGGGGGSIVVSDSAWSLTGNNSTNPSTNFIGTKDAQKLVIKTNNVKALTVNTNQAIALGSDENYGTIRRIPQSNGTGYAPNWIRGPDIIDTSVSKEYLKTWTAQVTPLPRIYVNVAWSPELRLLVCVAHGTTSDGVITSPDGVNWTTRTAPSQQWRGIAWSPKLGLFAAVASSGTGNRVMTSPDGITWTNRTSTADYKWRDICWSDQLGIFVAVSNTSGHTDKVMTSSDGITWTARTCPDREWSDICYAPEIGLFVVSATEGIAGGKIMTSPDGITWTLHTTPGDAGSWEGIGYSEDLRQFVAVNYYHGVALSGTNVMTSPDGSTWTLQTTPTDAQWLSVAWSHELGMWAAVNDNNSQGVMTSTDGENWVAQTPDSSRPWRRIIWVKELGSFVSCAYTFGTQTNLIMLSKPIDRQQHYLALNGRASQTIKGNLRIPDVNTGAGVYAARFDALGNLLKTDTTIGSGSGSTNTSIGSGYRWAVTGTNNVKSVFSSFAFNWDSTSHTNGLTGKIDTALLATIWHLDSTINAGGVSISSLGNGKGVNSISVGDFNQVWNWDILGDESGGSGLTLKGGTTVPGNETNRIVLEVTDDGYVNSGISDTYKKGVSSVISGDNQTLSAGFFNHSYGGFFSSSTTDGSSNQKNYGIYTTARLGFINNAIYADSGDVILNARSGNTGIGITSPTSKLHVVGSVKVESGSITGRWKARIGSTTSSGTPTINTDNVDIYKLTAQAAAITSFTTNLSGTPVDGDILEIQITDNGTARAITWGSSFVSSSVTLPTTTVISTTLTVVFQYYTTSSYGNNKYVCANYY